MPGHENNGKRTLGKRTPCTQSLTGTIGTMYKTFSFDARFPLFSLFCFFLEQKQHPYAQMALVSDGCLLTLFCCKQSKQWKQGCSCWSSGCKLVGSGRCTVLLIGHVACKGTPAPNSALGCSRQTQTRLLMGFHSHCGLNQSFQCSFEVVFGERSNTACNPDPDFLLGWLFSTYSNPHHTAIPDLIANSYLLAHGENLYQSFWDSFLLSTHAIAASNSEPRLKRVIKENK